MGKSKVDLLLQAAIGVLVLCLVAVFAYATRNTVIGVGDAAPAFSIRTEDGHAVSQTDFGGKLLVLNFWATWCAPCIEEMPSLDQFYRQLKDSGVVVLGVNTNDEDESAYRRFLQKAKLSFPIARDVEAEISASFGTFRYPETYIISRDGKVLQKIVGPADWSDTRLVSYVKSLL